MMGEEVARQLISTLSVTYGIESSLILAAMRNGASVWCSYGYCEDCLS